MLEMSVKKVTTNLNIDDSRPHLDGEEDDGRHAKKRAQACSENQGPLNHQAMRVEHIISYPKMHILFVFETLSDVM